MPAWSRASARASGCCIACSATCCSTRSRASPTRSTARCAASRGRRTIRAMHCRANAWLAAGLAALVGCASDPDSLTWSSALSRELYRQTNEVIEVARFSQAAPGAPVAPWEPFVVLRNSHPTTYRLAQLGDTVALEAESDDGGTGLYRKIKIAPDRYPLMEWRWYVPRAEKGAPMSIASRESPVVRLSLAFDGDPGKLDFDDRTKLRLAKLLTVNGLPYASLLYVWMYKAPIGTVIHSPHTDRVRMIVVENGEQHLGEWVSVQRNVL